ncbi:MAG TPA: YciI family protein [Acidobacteriota bacterium]|nr:YciI family protein [Acidobacteriota bacterium]
MSTLYLVFRNPGPAWVTGKGSREQPLWDEHAVFMDDLFDKGHIVLAGPYANYQRVLVIVNARNFEEASTILESDPWVSAGILLQSEVIEWNVFMDSRKKLNT